MTQYYKGMRVLVTGGGGFIGTHLVNELIKRGASVTSVLHKREPKYKIDTARYLYADLTLLDDCLRVTRDIDLVFMAAANTSGAAVIESTPLAHLSPNVVMNTFMLDACYQNRVSKFCFISSNTVYPLTDFPVRESDVNFEFYEKYFVVGWMKLFSEKMCKMYSEKISTPLSTIVVRPGNLYGPYDKFSKSKSKVIPAIVRRSIEKEEPFEVWGDGSEIKDFLYIDDFIDGLLLAAEQRKSYSEFNIASGMPSLLKDVIYQILEAADHSPSAVHFDISKPTMIPKRLINIEKITRTTGWKPRTSLKDGLAQTVEWYKKYYGDKDPDDEAIE